MSEGMLFILTILVTIITGLMKRAVDSFDRILSDHEGRIRRLENGKA
jgi:predicted anti-sigma-YlaC factor YlaD